MFLFILLISCSPKTVGGGSTVDGDMWERGARRALHGPQVARASILNFYFSVHSTSVRVWLGSYLIETLVKCIK